MLQLLHALLGRMPRGAPHGLGSGVSLVSLALVVVGCASPSLMPEAQAVAIKNRDRALASRADAIHAAISQSGRVGALAFLDAADGRLVVLPGDSPADAWSRRHAECHRRLLTLRWGEMKRGRNTPASPCSTDRR